MADLGVMQQSLVRLCLRQFLEKDLRHFTSNMMGLPSCLRLLRNSMSALKRSETNYCQHLFN